MSKTKISRRSFIKAGAASAAGLMALCAASPAAAAAGAGKAAPAAKAPKYIFLFIGDGMGDQQIQTACFYQGAVQTGGGVERRDLSFTLFPTVASVTTYDSSSFCPDSASTATSIASGHKTLSGVINMDESKTQAFDTISEQLHRNLGYKVGVVTSVNLNHATPAAFYAHQASRNSYYAIGQELCASGFEYFAGGDFLAPTGDGSQADLYTLAAQNGYTVARNQLEAEAINANTGKALIIAQQLADGSAMNYALDAAEGEWRLRHYVRKGIEVLDNPNGFFMMVESGKIDWACHANDAAASLHDVVDMGDAVQVAVDFYNQHPQDTLILVTADHETGGLAIGYATTNYDTFLERLQNQRISYAKFDTDYVQRYRAQNTPFEAAMQDVYACFGLAAAGSAEAAGADSLLVLTEYELAQLREAYQRTLEVGSSAQASMSQADYEKYGTYQPFSMAICHILNHKCGLDHTTYAHTGAPVSLFAVGCGAERFAGAYDNTQIYHKLAALTGANG